MSDGSPREDDDPSSFLSLEMERQIDLFCDEIELQLKRGYRPIIAEYLGRLPPDAEAHFLREVTQLLLAYTVPLTDNPNTFEGLDTATFHPAGDAVRNGSEKPRARLGDLLLLEEIGSGGMGVVYRARQIRLDRIVAVKVLRRDRFSHTAETRQMLFARFRREATTTAQLAHPNIVSIHDVVADSDQPYYVMQFVEGKTLGQRIAEGTLTQTDIARHLATVSRAVHFLHQAKILHRDIKPSNILIESETERPMVTDFGLAKLVNEQEFLTRAGETFGTPAYMPPEQVTDMTAVSVASDVYSLGATLYHALTGRPPYVDPNDMGILHQVLNAEPVAPRVLNPAIGQDLESICLKCLEKDQGARYQSALELAEDLERFLAHVPVRARPIRWTGRAWRWSKRNPTPALLICLVVVTLMAGSIVSSIFAFRAASSAHSAILAQEESVRRLAQQYRVTAEAAPSPALALPWLAQAIATEESIDESSTLDRIRFAGLLSKYPALENMWFHDAAINRLEWGPASDRVVSASNDRTACVWQVGREKPLLILPHEAAVTWATFSPDGTLIATATNDSRGYLWNARQGHKIAGFVEHEQSLSKVVFSRDGQHVASIGNDAALHLWSTTPELKHEKTIEHPQGITECAFVEDDQLVITLCVDGSVRIWNIGAGTLFKELKRATAPAASMDIAEKSRRIFVGYADGSIQGWSWVDGSESFRILPRHRDAVRCVAVHENLELLATGSHDRTACIWDLRTGQLLQSLAHGTSVQTVEFSADGASLLSAGRGGQVRLWDCVGGVEQTGPLYHSTDTTAVKYAPDARFIASASTDGSMRIWADSFTAPQKKMRSESPEVKSVVATPTGIAIAICEDGSLGIKPPSSQEIQAIPTPSPVQCIAIAEAGHAWAAGLHDGTILASQDLPASLDGKDVTRWTQSSRPTKIAIAEQAVVTASSSGILTLYRHGIAIPKEFARNATKVHWLNLSPDGKYCAVAAVNRLWIWQIDAAAPMLVAEYSFQGLISAALWTTSTQLALGADKDLNLLDVTSGRVASRQCSSISRLSMDDVHSRLLVSHSNGDLQLLRLPDLESVVPPITRGSVTLSSGFCKGLPLAYTLSGNRALYLWDYTTAQKVFETTVPGETPLAAIPDLEEGSLIICRRDGTFWPVSIDAIQNPQAEIVAWSEIISGCRLDARVGLRPLSPDQLLAAWKSRRVPVIANASQ